MGGQRTRQRGLALKSPFVNLEVGGSNPATATWYFQFFFQRPLPPFSSLWIWNKYKEYPYEVFFLITSQLTGRRYLKHLIGMASACNRTDFSSSKRADYIRGVP